MCAAPCPQPHLSGCNSPLEAGTQCHPQILTNRCVETDEDTLKFTCPVLNRDPNNPPDYLGNFPKQVCHVCGIAPELQDTDVRLGFYNATVSFGPAERHKVVDETGISEYRVYVVDSAGNVLGDTVAIQQPLNSNWDTNCCKDDAYAFEIALDLSTVPLYSRFMVFLVVDGIQLPVGAISGVIVDRTFDKCPNPPNCPTKYTAKQMNDGTPIQCQDFECDVGDECCDLLGTCASFECDADNHILKVPQEWPEACNSIICSLEECCDNVLAGAGGLQQASSAAALIAMGAILLCILIAFGAWYKWKQSRRQVPHKPPSFFMDILPKSANMRRQSTVEDIPRLDGDPEEAVAAEARRARDAELRRREVAHEGLIKRLVTQLRNHASTKEAEEQCCCLVISILQAVLENEFVEQYRCLEKSNEVLAEGIFTNPAAKKVVEAAGFKMDAAHEALILRNGAPMLAVKQVLEAMENRLSVLRTEIREAQISIIFPQLPSEVQSEDVAGDEEVSRSEIPESEGNEEDENCNDEPFLPVFKEPFLTDTRRTTPF